MQTQTLTQAKEVNQNRVTNQMSVCLAVFITFPAGVFWTVPSQSQWIFDDSLTKRLVNLNGAISTITIKVEC